MNRLVAATAFLLSFGFASSGVADRFNVSGMEVVTHRGTNLTLQQGKNVLDKGSGLTCTSDSGCAILIQVQLNRGSDQASGFEYKICTTVDGVEADPTCSNQTVEQYTGSLTSFQGKPRLSKGLHVLKTTITTNWGPIPIPTYQIVYTLYQKT